MDRMNSRIAQVYGYAVCFITVIVMLISVKSVVDAVIDLTDPIRADAGGYGRSGRSLSNFELYKLDARREPRAPVPVHAAPTKAQTDTLSDTEAPSALRRGARAGNRQCEIPRDAHFDRQRPSHHRRGDSVRGALALAARAGRLTRGVRSSLTRANNIYSALVPA